MITVPCALLASILPDGLSMLALSIGDASISIGLFLLELFVVPFWHPAVGSIGAILLGMLFFLRRHELVALVLLVFIGFRFRGVPENLEIEFLSIGQGDAALVYWPDGRTWLIDGGPKGTKLLKYLRRKGIHHLDAIFLSHPHPDHIGGVLPIIKELQVERVWTVRPPEKKEFFYQILWKEMEKKGIAIAYPNEQPEDGAVILHPLGGWRGPKSNRVNEESLVLKIEYGEHSFLFTGDIEKGAEKYLLPTLSPVTVVKVPHHGSKTSSTSDFVQRVQPQFTVFSCGQGNRFKHPHIQSLWQWRHSNILRTDLQGTIKIQSKGEGELLITTESDLRSFFWKY